MSPMSSRSMTANVSGGSPSLRKYAWILPLASSRVAKTALPKLRSATTRPAMRARRPSASSAAWSSPAPSRCRAAAVSVGA